METLLNLYHTLCDGRSELWNGRSTVCDVRSTVLNEDVEALRITFSCGVNRFLSLYIIMYARTLLYMACRNKLEKRQGQSPFLGGFRLVFTNSRHVRVFGSIAVDL